MEKYTGGGEMSSNTDHNSVEDRSGLGAAWVTLEASCRTERSSSVTAIFASPLRPLRA